MPSSLLIGLTVREGSIEVEEVDFHAVPNTVDGCMKRNFLIVRLRERRKERKREKGKSPHEEVGRIAIVD